MKAVLATLLAMPSCLAGLTTTPAGASDRVRQAEQAYLARDYAGAEKGYLAAIAAGGESADLEYDLGTAAAQAGDVGQAVLHLSRALKLSPWDADARRNLDRVFERRVDKVVGGSLGGGPLQRLLQGLPAAALTWLFGALWVLAFAIHALRRRARSLPVAILVAALACGALAWASARTQALPFAVVVAKVVPVRSGPGPDRPKSFEIHEGLEVLLRDRQDGWARVRLANGLEGWVEVGQVERI